jgi:hypothetical protein
MAEAVAKYSRCLAERAVVDASAGYFYGREITLLQRMRRVNAKEARFLFAEENGGAGDFSVEELPEEGREGPFGLSDKNKVETQPQRALRVARRMGAAGQEDRFFAQDHPQLFHFSFDLPELRGHERKTHDCFRGSRFFGYLLHRTGKGDAKISVQTFPFKAAEDHGKGVPVFSGLPEDQKWTLVFSHGHIFLYSFAFALSKESFAFRVARGESRDRNSQI